MHWFIIRWYIRVDCPFLDATEDEMHRTPFSVWDDTRHITPFPSYVRWLKAHNTFSRICEMKLSPSLSHTKYVTKPCSVYQTEFKCTDLSLSDI